MSADWTPPAEAVEAARAAYWPAYSEAVRNAPSNRNGQGITAADGATAARAGYAAALAAAYPPIVAAERERIALAIEAEKFPDGPGGAFGPSTHAWDRALGAAASIARAGGAK